MTEPTGWIVSSTEVSAAGRRGSEAVISSQPSDLRRHRQREQPAVRGPARDEVELAGGERRWPAPRRGHRRGVEQRARRAAQVRAAGAQDEEEARVARGPVTIAEDDAARRVVAVGAGLQRAGDEHDPRRASAAAWRARGRRGARRSSDPRDERHERDLQVAQDGRQAGADVVDRVVPADEVDREEDAGDGGEAPVVRGPRAERRSSRAGQDVEHRHRVGAAEHRGRRRARPRRGGRGSPRTRSPARRTTAIARGRAASGSRGVGGAVAVVVVATARHGRDRAAVGGTAGAAWGVRRTALGAVAGRSGTTSPWHWLDQRPRARPRSTHACARRSSPAPIAPGDALPSERQLSDELGASRHAVREALKRLQQAGLISISPGRRDPRARLAPPRRAGPPARARRARASAARARARARDARDARVGRRRRGPPVRAARRRRAARRAGRAGRGARRDRRPRRAHRDLRRPLGPRSSTARATSPTGSRSTRSSRASRSCPSTRDRRRRDRRRRRACGAGRRDRRTRDAEGAFAAARASCWNGRSPRR